MRTPSHLEEARARAQQSPGRNFPLRRAGDATRRRRLSRERERTEENGEAPRTVCRGRGRGRMRQKASLLLIKSNLLPKPPETNFARLTARSPIRTSSLSSRTSSGTPPRGKGKRRRGHLPRFVPLHPRERQRMSPLLRADPHLEGKSRRGKSAVHDSGSNPVRIALGLCHYLCNYGVEG